MLVMLGCALSLPASIIPPIAGSRPLDIPQGPVMLWYEDESVEDCEADGTLDPLTHRYTGWPPDCENVFFPALPHPTTAAVCESLRSQYFQREISGARESTEADLFWCDPANPTRWFRERVGR